MSEVASYNKLFTECFKIRKRHKFIKLFSLPFTILYYNNTWPLFLRNKKNFHVKLKIEIDTKIFSSSSFLFKIQAQKIRFDKLKTKFSKEN